MLPNMLNTMQRMVKLIPMLLMVVMLRTSSTTSNTWLPLPLLNNLHQVLLPAPALLLLHHLAKIHPLHLQEHPLEVATTTSHRHQACD